MELKKARRISRYNEKGELIYYKDELDGCEKKWETIDGVKYYTRLDTGEHGYEKTVNGRFVYYRKLLLNGEFHDKWIITYKSPKLYQEIHIFDKDRKDEIEELDDKGNKIKRTIKQNGKVVDWTVFLYDDKNRVIAKDNMNGEKVFYTYLDEISVCYELSTLTGAHYEDTSQNRSESEFAIEIIEAYIELKKENQELKNKLKEQKQ